MDFKEENMLSARRREILIWVCVLEENPLILTSNSLTVNSVNILKARDDLMLNLEGNLNLVLASFLQSERSVLHGFQGSLSIKSESDVSLWSSVTNDLHFLNDHTSRIVLC
jgi:hypothetical protein